MKSGLFYCEEEQESLRPEAKFKVFNLRQIDCLFHQKAK